MSGYIRSIRRLSSITGIDIMAPYPTNFFTLNSTLFSFKMPINIIPAREPTGVKNAQIFDAITTA